MRTSFASLVIAIATSSTFAEVHEILQQGLGFVPDTITASPGDTIRWIHGSGSHTVSHGDCTPANDSLFSGPLNASSTTFEWTIPDAVNGEISFYCKVGSHCSAFGMSGVINVVPTSGSIVHEVQQQGFTFVPAEITVKPGDTVQWTWSAGMHTVTSGDSSSCIADNIYFDVALNEVDNVVLWVVPENMPDAIDYFCDFHCGVGHVGTITRALVGDINGDGCINGADLSELLGNWGGTSGPADINQDGTIDGADLTIVLANWRPCP